MIILNYSNYLLLLQKIIIIFFSLDKDSIG